MPVKSSAHRATPAACTLVALALALPAHGAPAEDVDALLRERLADVGGRGGIVLAEVARGAPPRYRVAGETGQAARPAIDEHTIFEIGSVTKTVTAFLLADAVARGEVSLDDPLAKRLPARVGAGPAGAITLAQLATHTSGLPRLPTGARALGPILLRPRDPYRDVRAADIDGFLAGFQPPAERRWSYSNLGFALLGEAVAGAAGKPYEALFRERFAAPLGLRSTFLAVPDAERPRVALGHDGNGDPAPSWTLGFYTPAGGMRSTAHDMAIYLAALGEGALPHADALLAPRAEGNVAGRRSGLGWVLDRRHGADLVWHDGGMGGYRSFLGWDRRRGRGVVLLISAEREVTDLGLHLLDPAFPRSGPERPLGLALFAAVGPLFLAAMTLVHRRRRGVPATRLDVAGRALSAVGVLVFLWHLAPWAAIGGRTARAAAALAVLALSGIGLARARRLAWRGPERGARWALRVVGLVASAAVLAYAVARY